MTLQVSCVQMHWAGSLEKNLERPCGISEPQPSAVLGSYCSRRPASRATISPMRSTRRAFRPRSTASAPRRAEEHAVWVIAGTIRKTTDRHLNLAHVIAPDGSIVHEYAKVHMAGRDEKRYCRGGNKLSLFEIDGIPCTLIICRDGRHPELYRIPAMAGAQVLFHPSCSSDEIEAVCWKRTSGRAQQPVGPNSKIFHCVANTIGEAPDGKQTSSGASFIREPNGIPLAEAGYYQEEMITAVLDLSRADRSYILDSMQDPPFLRGYWEAMVVDVRSRAHLKPE